MHIQIGESERGEFDGIIERCEAGTASRKLGWLTSRSVERAYSIQSILIRRGRIGEGASHVFGLGR